VIMMLGFIFSPHTNAKNTVEQNYLSKEPSGLANSQVAECNHPHQISYTLCASKHGAPSSFP
jgi:hypothetical protein